MDSVTIYTTDYCGYCRMAKSLLAGKGIPYTEIDVGLDAAERQKLIERTGRRTVPQIFIGERHVGGFDDLAALERSGGLQAA
ncbi:glutaredoxin 3 [Massilia sp. KIM]|uniref:glutaredoxin 3 n=1 Tax=Massilia sp. KIM TaxID=1955422 RepID=UPI00098EF0AA|nr:glutaredoxin 3 [Massilia sp. KIM]OON62573.1 glutaredoxin 3 [Massilia sp. KIM]